jgi:hypothetical protein
VHGIIRLVSLDIDMKLQMQKIIAIGSVFAATLLLSEPAAAFRCGSKLVKDGMHELEVVKICGQPASIRHLGYAVRSVEVRAHGQTVPGWTISRSPAYHFYPAEVMVTEYVYNLGPQKLMRRLVFEGGLLVSVETIGRGHRD